MTEYERSREVHASSDDVFAFLSNPGNLATILPTVDTVEPRDEGRIHVSGNIHDRPYEDNGWFHIDEARRRLEWGSDERTYSGWLTVSGDDGRTQVVAHLSFAPHFTPSGRPITGESPDEPDPVEESLEAALDSLRNLMEGRGGKEEPAIVG